MQNAKYFRNCNIDPKSENKLDHMLGDFVTTSFHSWTTNEKITKPLDDYEHSESSNKTLADESVHGTTSNTYFNHSKCPSSL